MVGPKASTLDGVGVLITRPVHQAESLAQLIEQAGGRAFRFPTLAILPPRNPGALDQLLNDLGNFTVAIFISPNAVEFGLTRLQQRAKSLPANLLIAAVGAGTAAALKRFGVDPIITPTTRFDSESLLTLPALQQVAGKPIIIFRGEGGRELLGQTLRERGARVSYAECYRRERPQVDTTPLTHALLTGTIDIISVTSNEGLRNLADMVANEARSTLLQTPIVVVSESQAQTCRQLGFTTEPWVAAEASDTAILNAIQTWRSR